MRYAEVRAHLLSLPGATVTVQWGADHVFKVGGKMFAVMGPESARPHRIAFKASDESFHILTQQKDIMPAPYLARAHWVYMKKLDALSSRELKAYLARAHAIIASGLPKKTQAALGLNREAETKVAKRPSARRRPR